MATHKSAAVAARQRVDDKLRAQRDALTAAVEAGITAIEAAQAIDAERSRILTELDTRYGHTQDQLSEAVAAIKKHGMSTSDIAELLGVPQTTINKRRPVRGTRTTRQPRCLTTHRSPTRHELVCRPVVVS